MYDSRCIKPLPSFRCDEDTDIHSNEEDSTSNDADPDWPIPYRAQQELKKKPTHIQLNLPAKSILDLLSKASIVNKFRVTNELKMVATLIKSGNAIRATILLSCWFALLSP